MLTVVVALSGCGRYYWQKPGVAFEQFDAESRACAAQVSPAPRPGEYGVFDKSAYQTCLSAKGWTRAKQMDPPPSGWYRGFE